MTTDLKTKLAADGITTSALARGDVPGQGAGELIVVRVSREVSGYTLVGLG